MVEFITFISKRRLLKLVVGSKVRSETQLMSIKLNNEYIVLWSDTEVTLEHFISPENLISVVDFQSHIDDIHLLRIMYKSQLTSYSICMNVACVGLYNIALLHKHVL